MEIKRWKRGSQVDLETGRILEEKNWKKSTVEDLAKILLGLKHAPATTTAIKKNVINLQMWAVKICSVAGLAGAFFAFVDFAPIFVLSTTWNDSFCSRFNDQHKNTCRQIYPVFSSPQTAHTDLIPGYYSKYTFRKPGELE